MNEERIARRLTTIFAADVAGFTRMSREDEEGTLRTLRAYRGLIDKLIARHDGRIFGSAGDSVIAEFSSAVEAVRCAMSVQEELRVRNTELPDERRMQFRIGINVGDVLVEGDNLFGDGVNIAARLESIAPPGGIMISGSTFEQVRNKLSVHFENSGQQQVKNINEPVATFRIVPGPAPVVAKRGAPSRAFGADGGAGSWLRLAAVIVLGLLVGAGGVFGWQYWRGGGTAIETPLGIAGGNGAPTGLTVRRITYGKGGQTFGTIAVSGDQRWRDVREGGAPVEYEETNRDEGAVFLVDRSRGVRLQLDLRARKIYYSDRKRPQRRAVFDIIETGV